MQDFFRKPIRKHIILTAISLTLAGVLLWHGRESPVLFIFIFLLIFVIFSLYIKNLYLNYIKPLTGATRTVDEILNGNYNARFHTPGKEPMEELSTKVNALARNMNRISMQEQMNSERMTTIIDNMQSGLVLVDEKGFINVVNRKFISLFGKTPKDYNGYLYYDALENDVFHQTVQQTFLYEETVQNNIVLENKIDKTYLEVIGAPIINERNMLKGAVLVFFDVSELKKMDKTRKDFVANVSHELRTPITSIKGFAETLLDDGTEDAHTRKEFLSIIYNESNRLELLIEDLLALSRLEKEEFRLVLERFSSDELFVDILPAMEHKAEKKNLRIEVTGEREVSFMADKERLKQVVVNLVDNAINYTPDGGLITIETEEGKDYSSISVTDTGIGMKESKIARIFERFYRIDKARSRDTGGTGLGLAIVKHIVEVHDGKIEVESEVDKGTSIKVYIPN